VGRGKIVKKGVKKIGMTEQNYYPCLKTFDGRRIDLAKWLKVLALDGTASPRSRQLREDKQ